MARKVRLSYPTQVVGRMIEQDTADAFKLGAARACHGDAVEERRRPGIPARARRRWRPSSETIPGC